MEAAYLRGDTPQAGSGFGGTAEAWRGNREMVLGGVDRGGTFLDVGCANGLLMESVHWWAAECGLRVEPYGVDLGGDCAKTVTGYITGNLLISVIYGLLTYGVLAVLGVPYAGLIALFVGLTDLIPLVGATLGAVVGVIAGIVVIVFLHHLPAGRESSVAAGCLLAHSPAEPAHRAGRDPDRGRARRHPRRAARHPGGGHHPNRGPGHLEHTQAPAQQRADRRRAAEAHHRRGRRRRAQTAAPPPPGTEPPEPPGPARS